MGRLGVRVQIKRLHHQKRELVAETLKILKDAAW
jgi:hypothetical protein